VDVVMLSAAAPRRRLWMGLAPLRPRCEALTYRGGRCLRSGAYLVAVAGQETGSLICGVHAGELDRTGSLEVLS
jgi:hypothetical protein